MYLLFCSVTLLFAPFLFLGGLGSLLGLVFRHLLHVPVGATKNASIMQTQGYRIPSSILMFQIIISQPLLRIADAIQRSSRALLLYCEMNELAAVVKS